MMPTNSDGICARLVPLRSSPAAALASAGSQHDKTRYRDRWRIEAAFCRLKDFCRVATRYDKLAANSASAVALATVIAFWC